MRRGAPPVLGGVGVARGEARGEAGCDAGAEAPALGEASGMPELKASITAPWSGSETAACVPSGEMAMGPSSGPSFNGNGLRTPASALSQYHAPVPNSRTATSPDWPGAAPSVKKAAWVGGFDSTLSGASYEVDAKQPVVRHHAWRGAPLGRPIVVDREVQHRVRNVGRRSPDRSGDPEGRAGRHRGDDGGLTGRRVEDPHALVRHVGDQPLCEGAGERGRRAHGNGAAASTPCSRDREHASDEQVSKVTLAHVRCRCYRCAQGARRRPAETCPMVHLCRYAPRGRFVTP